MMTGWVKATWACTDEYDAWMYFGADGAQLFDQTVEGYVIDSAGFYYHPVAKG